jgi:hypothetical protein
VLIFLAMIPRYAAEIVPAARTIDLVAAAVAWIGALLIWRVKVPPKITMAEPEESA